MGKILVIGKMNGILKDIMNYLAKKHSVQACPPVPESVMGMIGLVEPDAAVLSLVGAPDISPVLFNRLGKETPWLPVVTVGTESERDHFLKYYGNSQFENLARPVDNARLLLAVERRMRKTGAEEEPAPEEQEGSDGRKLVLLVDDDPAMLRTLGNMIGNDYRVAAATSGAQAMTAIGRSRPDAILLDYEMPVCDGKMTLEMIRSEEDLSSIPVVFLTGVRDRAHIESVLSLRPAGYLLKPPSMDIILDTLKKVTAGRKLY